MGLVEETLFHEFFLEPLEDKLKLSNTERFDLIDGELVLTASLIDGNAAVGDELQTGWILTGETDTGTAPDHAAKLGSFIF